MLHSGCAGGVSDLKDDDEVARGRDFTGFATAFDEALALQRCAAPVCSLSA
jgi:hypothetical protein